MSGFELADLLKEKETAFERRAECLAAMGSLYRRLFSREGFERIAFKYWTPLTQPFGQEADDLERPDRERLREAMFKTLKGILSQPARSSFLSAANGLLLLRHPQGPEAMRQELAARPGAPAADRAFVEACMEGRSQPCPFPSRQEKGGLLGLAWLKVIAGH